MAGSKQSKPSQLDGSELTHEQFSDVYMAGTSDGVQQLADGEVVVKPEPYDTKDTTKKRKKS